MTLRFNGQTKLSDNYVREMVKIMKSYAGMIKKSNFL